MMVKRREIHWKKLNNMRWRIRMANMKWPKKNLKVIERALLDAVNSGIHLLKLDNTVLSS